MPPNTSAHRHQQAMPLPSQNVFQAQTAGVLPPPMDRTTNAWSAIDNTSRPLPVRGPTVNPLSGPRNDNCTLLFSTRGDFVGLVRPPPARVAVPPRYCATPLRTSFSYRTAFYPTTRGIMTAETQRQVHWNPDADYYQGMYTRPPVVQVVRPQSHYRLHAASGVPVRRLVPAASQNYAGGPQSFNVCSEQYVLPSSGFPLVSSYENCYAVPGSPVLSDLGVDSADTPISLDVDWAIIHRKVFDTVNALEWSGPVAIANTLLTASFESTDALMFHAVVILLVIKQLKARRSLLVKSFIDRLGSFAMAQFWHLWRDGTWLNLSEPLFIEDFPARFKLGLGVARAIGCLFRIGIIHGSEVIKCLDFLLDSEDSIHRLSAIHAIVSMAGVKFCSPKYTHEGVVDIYRDLGSIYIESGIYNKYGAYAESGAYVWAPEGPSSPSYTLLMEIMDTLDRWFEIQHMKRRLKEGGIATHDAFLPA